MLRGRAAGLPILGREAELVVLGEFLASDRGPAALVLTGESGIGKTTLCNAGIEEARERGFRVLVARPSGAEAQLAFASLIDLFDGVDLDGLALPAPQRRALEVALLRADGPDVPPESRAIAVGCSSALRALGAGEPLLIAIDDVQWLDGPSADALAFAARRLEGGDVRFLLARRPESASTLERALEQREARHLDVAPLSLGATRRLLSERLGLSLRRPLLRQIFESSLGNPLFALELARSFEERGAPVRAEDMLVPERLEDLLGTRVEELPAPARRLLLAVALSGDLSVQQLETLADREAVDEAIRSGLLVADGDRVRPTHPLLATAAKRCSRADERRELHRELADVVVDAEFRALHLALATEVPDAELARTVAEAAASLSSRGARHEAVALADHALRLTPSEAPERADRLLSLAEYLDMAGDPDRVSDLLLPELESLPPGAPRVRACLLLNRVVANEDEVGRYLARALAESDGAIGPRASVLLEMTVIATSIRVEGIREAEAWALEAQAGARLAGPELERAALDALAWTRALRGLPIDDVCERFAAIADTAVYVAASPERTAGQRLAWRGEIARARTIHSELQARADEHGEAFSYALQGLHLCELELRAGRWEHATSLLEDVVALEEILDASSAERLTFPVSERCRALLAAGRGLRDEAEERAARALQRAEDSGGGWDLLEARRAAGIAALLAHEPARSVESMHQVWEHTQREGVDDPGVFPVAPELVEALVELGDVDEALAVTARLRELAERMKHPWGLVTARRCAALIRLAGSSYDEEAAAEFARAATAYRELGLGFDGARSLLCLGRAQRRHRKWAAARDSLQQAAGAFDELGSPGWAGEARAELSRVGARRPRPTGELTPAERRVAELAAEGLANKEIARGLFVSVKTVETHLSRAYGKLGVRSRTQLARRLSEQ